MNLKGEMIKDYKTLEINYRPKENHKLENEDIWSNNIQKS